MCKGSVFAYDVEDAHEGESYQVSDGGHPGYRIGVLHRTDQGRGADGAIACAACIRTPTKVSLFGLTPEMQDLYEVGPIVDALFVPNEAAPANMQDVIEFANGNMAPLIDFADSSVRIALTQAVQHAGERALESVAA